MKRTALAVVALMTAGLFLPGCQPPATDDRPTVVVTYAILGSLVEELAGVSVRIVVSIPNGLDPHEWEPSARDIEAINNADLVVQNGLGLEHGMEDTLAEAERRGVRFFTAADYIDIRYTGPGEDTHEHDGEHEHEEGAPDPHIWTDPTAMRSVILALAEELEARFGLELSGRASDLSASLDQLDAEIAGLAAGIPEIQRELVTGHESLGYFARRYGFHLVGAVIPSLTSQAEVSAADLAALKELILEHQVKVIFTETGTPSAVAAAVSRETGARLVELNTHLLPADGSYFTMMREMARTIVEALE